jgi:hypothetical protein
MGSLLSGTTNPDSPMRPLHASFHYFLTDKASSGEFFIDKIDLSKAQHDLAYASLRVMKNGLRFNTCDLKSSYLPNSEDPDCKNELKNASFHSYHIHLDFGRRTYEPRPFDEELANEVKLLFGHERLSYGSSYSL